MGTDAGAQKVVGQALREAGAALAGERAAAKGEQIAMLPVPGSGHGARAKRLRLDAAATNRKGRAPGAVNIANKQLREYLLARGVHPLQRMMEWMLHTPASLAAELGCKKAEAFELLRKLWSDAAPYFAPKMVPTDDQGREVPFFQMILGGQHAHLQGAPGVPVWIDPATGRPWGAPQQTQQNQGVPVPAAAVSHEAKSHEDEE